MTVLKINFRWNCVFFRLLCYWCKLAPTTRSNGSDPKSQRPVICWTGNWESSNFYHEAICMWSWMLWRDLLQMGGAVGDFGLADLWHYRAANQSGSNSWKKEQGEDGGEGEEEEGEACRSWLRRCSFWKENKFDLLSLNNNNNTLSSSCCSVEDCRTTGHKSVVNVCRGAARNLGPSELNNSTDTLNIYNPGQIAGLLVLLWAPWMIQRFPWTCVTSRM